MKDIYEIKPTGTLKIVVKDLEGNIVREEEDNNLVLTEASEIIANAIGGNSADNQIDHFAVGDDGTATDVLDVTIGGLNTEALPFTLDVDLPVTGPPYNAFMSAVDTISYPTPGQVQFECTLGYTEANTLTIREFGLITPLGDVRLFARKVVGDLVKTASLQIEMVWILQF